MSETTRSATIGQTYLRMAAEIALLPCSPDIKIGIMQFSIFHRVLEVWIVDSVDHGADLLDDLRLMDDRPI